MMLESVIIPLRAAEADSQSEHENDYNPGDEDDDVMITQEQLNITRDQQQQQQQQQQQLAEPFYGLTKKPSKLIQSYLPKDHPATLCIWSDLTYEYTMKLEKLTTYEDIIKYLESCFMLDSSREKRDAIILDLFYYTINFSRKHHFTPEQTSVIFSIIKRCQDVCAETPYDNLEQCFNYFKNMLLCHSIKRPPFSIEVFTQQQIPVILEYFTETYFRHFKIYKHVFTPTITLDLSIKYSGMVTPPPTPPTAQEPEPDSAVDDEGGGGEDQRSDQQNKQESALSPRLVELQNIIAGELSAKLDELKITIDDRLDTTDAMLCARLAEVQGVSGRSPPPRGAKNKPRGGAGNKNKTKQKTADDGGGGRNRKKLPQSASQSPKRGKNKTASPETQQHDGSESPPGGVKSHSKSPAADAAPRARSKSPAKRKKKKKHK